MNEIAAYHFQSNLFEPLFLISFAIVCLWFVEKSWLETQQPNNNPTNTSRKHRRTTLFTFQYARSKKTKIERNLCPSQVPWNDFQRAGHQLYFPEIQDSAVVGVHTSGYIDWHAYRACSSKLVWADQHLVKISGPKKKKPCGISYDTEQHDSGQRPPEKDSKGKSSSKQNIILFLGYTAAPANVYIASIR